MTRPPLLLAAAFAFLAASCGPESPPQVDSPYPSIPVAGGSGSDLSLNGTSVTLGGGPERNDECSGNGLYGAPTPYPICHNGPLLSGPLASVSLSSATLADGVALDGPATLSGTVFSGTVGGVPVQGTSFVKARFTGTLASGSAVQLQIDSALQGSGSHADIWEYVFSYQDAGGNWQPLCASAVTAVPVLGRWDYSQGTSTGGDKINDPTVFTVGCQGSAVAKCVNAGYKPWATVSGVSLDNHHQACVRMIRADYCGNGSSYTTAGRTIDLYDNLGIQDDTEGWIREAEWTPGGASCVFLLNRSLLGGLLCSPLLGVPALLSCGNEFSPGTLLISETPTGPLGGLLGTSPSTQAR